MSYPAITASSLGGIPVSFPLEVSEQNEILSYLEKALTDIRAQLERTNRGIELLTEYRTTLISEVVTGKIDVRDEAIP